MGERHHALGYLEKVPCRAELGGRPALLSSYYRSQMPVTDPLPFV